MKVIQNSKFRIQNLIIFFLLFLILNSKFYISTISATESTPSSEIKNKLEELKREIASKAAKLKQEVNTKLTNKAYVGVVKTNSSVSLTLASSKGPKLISLNEYTVFESKLKKKKKFSLKTLAEEDYVAALGDVDETGVLTAKKVILLPTPNYLLKTYIWGQVVSSSDKLITLKDRTLKNIAVSLPSGTTVKNNDFIIATGTKNAKDIFEAQFVYVIPQGGILKPKKIVYPLRHLLKNCSASDLSFTTSTALQKPSSLNPKNFSLSILGKVSVS